MVWRVFAVRRVGPEGFEPSTSRFLPEPDYSRALYQVELRPDQQGLRPLYPCVLRMAAHCASGRKTRAAARWPRIGQGAAAPCTPAGHLR